ncbi:GAF domain-containing sensor histidine kinase [Cytophagales bacterium LB-30]|uniref:histidine kinase n=1 Tax=Shiella aurantiaca TaxID=3058365 RepID=A0ABT8F245_9BACT|nr:GAF domain-containing sensor histidine kinase [Shiella aurantiaca]MDN4164321.1 GAF domain-containing sensor histidine kinase [Shiella aurantiaca]
MKVAAFPKNESERLKALEALDILDTVPEKEYQEIVELASEICQSPISLVTLVDEDRQWFKAKKGLAASETSRNSAFCAHAILRPNELMEVEDTAYDERFIDNPLVLGDPNIRFYAGMPIKSESGYPLGTLCVIDTVPRKLNDFQRQALQTLANQVNKQLELREKVANLERIQRELEEQKQQLSEMGATKDRLLAIIGHDLKSPLVNIRSTISLFEDNSLSEKEIKEMFPQLASGVDSTVDLVENLLKWAHAKFGDEHTVIETVYPFQLAQEIGLLYHQAMKKKNIVFLNHLASDLAIHTDKNVLSFLFRNLISNAIKFTSNGNISVAYRKENQFHCFQIVDSGIGIPEDKLELLFSWNQKKVRKGTSGEKGTGLGLQTCQELTEKLGGTLRVESKVGHGSTFSILLPII